MKKKRVQHDYVRLILPGDSEYLLLYTDRPQIKVGSRAARVSTIAMHGQTTYPYPALGTDVFLDVTPDKGRSAGIRPLSPRPDDLVTIRRSELDRLLRGQA